MTTLSCLLETFTDETFFKKRNTECRGGNWGYNFPPNICVLPYMMWLQKTQMTERKTVTLKTGR